MTYFPDNVLTETILKALLSGAFPVAVNKALRRYLRFKFRKPTIFSLFRPSESGIEVFIGSWFVFLLLQFPLFFMPYLNKFLRRLNPLYLYLFPTLPALVPWLLWKHKCRSLERRRDRLGIALCKALIALDPRFRSETEPGHSFYAEASLKALRLLDNDITASTPLLLNPSPGHPDSPHLQAVKKWFDIQDGLEELECEDEMVQNLIEDSMGQNTSENS